jgi:DNA-binding XRE family transcriptional regulator
MLTQGLSAMAAFGRNSIFDEYDGRSEFGAYLRMLRKRIPPETAMLGSSVRLPVRCGRRVTQEELAEVLGVSRNWYRRLESGGVRASTKLLARLAKTFAFTSEEHTKLFLLALPEIRFIGGAP